jgi:hypothetical protein
LVQKINTVYAPIVLAYCENGSLNREGAGCLGLSFKRVLNYKTLLVLLLVVLVNLAAAVLVWRLDLFIHSDLYEIGLVYSLGWVIHTGVIPRCFGLFLAAQLLL